jgi:hypothetical protein
MITIDKTIKIPENRHVSLEFDAPDNIPIGEAKFKVTITPTFVKRQTLED